MAVPNIFGTATSAIPLSQLDTNFATPVTIGNTAVQLGNTVTSFGNVTLTNVTISSGNVTITGANVSGTANVSTLIITGNQTSLGNVSITGNVSANIATFGAGSNTAPAITTTGDTNTGIFFPAADTIAFSEGGVEAARFDSAGNFGIGTTSPIRPLQVGAYGSGNGEIAVGASTTGYNSILFGDSATDFYQGYVQYQHNGDFMAFATAAAERARIDSSGRLGIGSTNPSEKLTIETAGTSTTTSILLGARTSGGDSVRLVTTQNSDGTATFNSDAGGNGTAGFIFKNSGSEKARIDSSGNLGIGTSSPSSRLSVAGDITLTAASPTISTALNDYLDIKATNAGGAVRIYSGNSLAIQCNSAQVITMPNLAGAGTRAVNANAAGELSAASDSRLKQEVEGQTLPSLAEVMKLEVKAYKWLDDINVRGADAAVEIGFFADQVAPIIPSAAPMGRDGYYGFYDRSVIAALVNAIKEQQALITQLTARITALETA